VIKRPLLASPVGWIFAVAFVPGAPTTRLVAAVLPSYLTGCPEVNADESLPRPIDALPLEAYIERDAYRQVSRLHLYRATHGGNCLADD
jgi:hypothetical protein